MGWVVESQEDDVKVSNHHGFILFKELILFCFSSCYFASLFSNSWGWDLSLLCPCCEKGGKPWAFPGIQHTSTHPEGPGWSGMFVRWRSLGAEWVKRKRLNQGLGNSDDKTNSSFVVLIFCVFKNLFKYN